MKKLLLLPFLFLIALSGAIYWFYDSSKSVSEKTEYANFNIASGASATQIGSNLKKQGLIKNPTAFKIYIQFTGMSSRIQAGDYRLSPSFNLFQVVDQLSKAPLEVRVTIPEGLRREEIAQKFAKSLDQDSKFIRQFLIDSEKLEGYLFPDTYLVSNTATPGAIIEKMTSNFRLKVSGLSPSASKLTQEELVILASLIERETKSGSERPIVSGILFNRLALGMPLQIDATAQYAIANLRCTPPEAACDWWQAVSASDLSVSSPFNTYKNTGLPPGAIANPGLTALEAAFRPEVSDYFYYIHDLQGVIHYARNLEEQNVNIQRFLR